MADLSTGNVDNSVSRTDSFKLTPSRSVSRKQNIFTKMLSRGKKSGKYAVPEVAESYTEDVVKLAERLEVAPKVIDEGVAALENLVQEITIANPVGDSKESTPATVDKKPGFFNKIMQAAGKGKEELQAKAVEKVEKIANEGGVKDAYNALTQKDKAPVDHPLDGKSAQESSSVEPSSGPGPSLAERLQDDAVTNDQEVATGGQTEENKQEENCVASLAQGLLKICSPGDKKEN